MARRTRRFPIWGWSRSSMAPPAPWSCSRPAPTSRICRSIPRDGRVYAMNRGPGTISVIDPDTDAMVDTLKADRGSLTALNPVTNRLYVSASTGTDPAGHRSRDEAVHGHSRRHRRQCAVGERQGQQDLLRRLRGQLPDGRRWRHQPADPNRRARLPPVGFGVQRNERSAVPADAQQRRGDGHRHARRTSCPRSERAACRWPLRSTTSPTASTS